MKSISKESGIKRLVAFALMAVIVLSCVLGACKNGNEGGATADSSSTDAFDTQNFVFASGITVGGTDISGMSFDTAFQAVEANADIFVHDFTLKVVADDKDFEYKKSDFKWNFDIEEALLAAAQYCQSEDFDDNTAESGTGVSTVYSADLSLEVDASSVTAIVDAIAKEIDVAAVDSTFSVDGDDVTISREKAGKQLDKEDLTDKITAEASVLGSGAKTKSTVKAVVNEIEPQYKFESLDGEIKLLATYTTYSENTLDGDHNMALALASCNGSVINPGEVWSFNDCTGNSNLESLGYRPATVIMNGKFEQGIGGGICQASSTIYNAAIMANMEIVERYCHAYQSSYVPAGRDATIDYPYLDLKLSNPTDYPMYMQCYMENAYLTVNIFGWDDPAFDYIEIESAVDSSNKESYRASAWRVYYLDDEEVDREELPVSWYDYPKDDDDETKPTKPKTTKPKATKPAETKPKATKPLVTEPAETKPQPTTPAAPLPSDPVEVTTTPVNPQVTETTSKNEDQIPTATAHY